MKPLQARALRDAFGTFLTGVTVVTAVGEEDTPVGFTANSFSSVSLDPPLVLVCLAKSSSNLEAFRAAKGFAVNILSEKQQDVSNTFARPVEDRFASVAWRPGPYGAPVFEGVSAWFDCATSNIVDGGDHIILIGEVKDFQHGLDNGLGYARGNYFTLGLEREAANAVASEGSRVVSAVIECDGRVLLAPDPRGGFGLPSTRIEGTRGAVSQLTKLIGELGLVASIGFIFSVYEDRKTGSEHVVYHCVAADGTPSTGEFIDIEALPLEEMRDGATQAVLSRFAEESRMGQFSVYFGDESQGKVRRRSTGSES